MQLPLAPNANTLYFTPRLTGSLSAVLSFPLTVVEAPMGYGKTVAVREFLHSNTIKTVWVPILGNAEAVFWRTFCRALATAFPQYEDVSRSLLDLGYPYDSVRANAVRELMLQMDFSEPTALVLDDYHLLPGAGPAAVVELLAKAEMENLHLVLITRSPYAGNLEMLKLKGLLAHVGVDSFALRADEIRAYYKACGVALNKDEALELERTTGGWISALYLYLLRRIKHGGLSRPAGLNALINKEVYAFFSPELKELLAWLSPLARFSPEQAAYLAGQDSVHGLLAELCEKNSFVIFDEAAGMYVMHSIFRAFLGERFARLLLERRRAIELRNGDWFTHQGETARAVEAYYAAGAFEKALDALDNDMDKSMVTENAAFFLEFFKACPDEALKRHMPAAFKYALAAFSIHNYPVFGAQCAWIAQSCERAEDADAARRWKGELEFLYSLMAYNDIAAMSVHHKRAYELLGGPTRLFGPDSPWTLGCPSVLFMFHRKNGSLQHELKLMRECLPFYYLLAQGHGSGGEYLMEAEAFFNAGDFEAAEIVCHKAEAMASRNSQLGNVFCAMFLRMRLALFAGEYGRVRDLAEEMRGMIKKGKDYFLLHTADMCEGFIHAALGRVERIPRWLKTDEEEIRLYTFARGFFYAVHGRVLLLDQQYAKIIGLFEYLLESGQFKNYLLFQIYAGVFIAAALSGLGKTTAAGERLEEALRLALADEIYMPFVENYDVLESMLKRSGNSLDLTAGVAKIQTLASAWEKSKKKIRARYFSEKALPLTAREMELARLALRGLKYKEIAQALHLAPTTVKKAFAVMYQKLGIAGRGELREYLAGQL